ncbi:hypothetical protein QE152_g28498 [Popillia japonica]|uniref:Uncharacterized protein n=1 Tax=Popillia japonica TaxID=7064 RepID=A0AAW1JJE2_POPJA
MVTRKTEKSNRKQGEANAENATLVMNQKSVQPMGKTVGNARSRTTLQYAVDFVKGFRQGVTTRNVQDVTEETSTADRDLDNMFEELLNVSSIQEGQSKNVWYEKLTLERLYKIKFKLDTGSQNNNLKLELLSKVDHIGNNNLKICEVNSDNDSCKETFIRKNIDIFQGVGVFPDKYQIKIDERVDIDIFQGVGVFPDKYQIKIDERVEPTIKPPRRLPHTLSNKLKTELEKLIKAGIIEKMPKLNLQQEDGDREGGTTALTEKEKKKDCDSCTLKLMIAKLLIDLARP